MMMMMMINDICRKCQEKLETIERITGVCCRVLAQGSYTHCHSQ